MSPDGSETLADIPVPSVVAILPCNDLDAAEAWWNRLGFRRPVSRDDDDYRVLSDDVGASVHLTKTVEGWVVPGRNPFGVYICTPRVDELARAAEDAVVGPSRRPEHKPWGMYEIALNGPDDLLVRIGWPSRLKL
ncbi:glyoxalase [Acetobacter musti]|uniref:Glyoxalase n=1 Tax=Acetobacter musti TaxID=864732 RepID=A0ABX0JMI0_9PROT|nr:glyoxalase [Acetobacter musti]